MIEPDNEQTRSQCAVVIARGGVVAFRTDTFYGLGVDPFHHAAIQQLKKLKGREEGKPILVLISDIGQLDRLISKRSPAFELLAERFWPGPLTIVGMAAPGLSDELTAGTKTVGVRLPDDVKVRALVRSCGGALTATSANPSGAPPARSAAEVAAYFGPQLELVIDDGVARTDRPSSVVDATGALRLIREGIIGWSEIQDALNQSSD